MNVDFKINENCNARRQRVLLVYSPLGSRNLAHRIFHTTAGTAITRILLAAVARRCSRAFLIAIPVSHSSNLGKINDGNEGSRSPTPRFQLLRREMEKRCRRTLVASESPKPILVPYTMYIHIYIKTLCIHTYTYKGIYTHTHIYIYVLAKCSVLWLPEWRKKNDVSATLEP